jgi:hypothetical protein
MRYFNASSQPYISDFVPQDMNFIYKMQQDLIKEDEAANLDLEKNKVAFNLPGGPGTQEAAQKLSQQYNDETNKIASELASGNLKARDASLRAKTLLYHFATNPEVLQVKKDAAYNDQVNKALGDSGFQQMGIMDAYDKKTGAIKQLTGIVNDSELAQRYGVTLPGDTFKDYKDNFDAIKPIITKTYNNPEYITTLDELGNLHTKSISSGDNVETKTKEQVKKELAEYILKDPNALNKPSIIYNRKKAQQEGREYTNQNALDDITNAFLGQYTKKEEWIKEGADKITKPGTGSGNRNSNEPSPLPNDILELNKNLDMNNGKASVDNQTAASLLGGTYDDKENVSKININNETPTFLVAPKIMTGLSDDKENVELAKALPYQIKINKLRKTAKTVLEKNRSEGKLYTVTDQNSKYYNYQYYIDPSGIVHQTDPSGIKQKLTLDQFVSVQDEYEKIVESANSQGIDITNPKYKKGLKTTNAADLEKVNEIALAINTLEGPHNFYTDPNSKNVFAGDGDPYVKGYIIATKEELDNLKDFNFSKALELKIISKMLKKDADGNEQYKVPMIRRVEGNTDNMVAAQLLGKYKGTEYALKQTTEQQRAVKEYINDKKEIKDFVKLYNENPEGLNSEISQNATTIFQSNPQTLQLFNNKIKEINNSKESKETKAIALYLLHLNVQAATGDKNAENKYNRAIEKFKNSPPTMGKQKEEWVQTPAKPLK